MTYPLGEVLGIFGELGIVLGIGPDRRGASLGPENMTRSQAICLEGTWRDKVMTYGSIRPNKRGLKGGLGPTPIPRPYGNSHMTRGIGQRVFKLYIKILLGFYADFGRFCPFLGDLELDLRPYLERKLG
jgi:hypothetical protein